MFNKDVDYNEVADKIEQVADAIEDTLGLVFSLVDKASVFCENLDEQLRQRAEELREKAPAKDVPNPPTGATREEKIAYISQQFTKVGVTNSKWTNPSLLGSIPDYVVDTTYAAFGGK